jgi:hypothetical protein
MNMFLKLGQKIEECIEHVFNQGFNYEDANDYVKLVFEETGLIFGVFDYVEKSEIQGAINYLDKKILK